MQHSRLVRRIPLKRTPSKKQAKRLKEWRIICNAARQKQIDAVGFVYCVLCGKAETLNQTVWGHHKDRNRANNTEGNCELDHYVCHVNEYHGGMFHNPFV